MGRPDGRKQLKEMLKIQRAAEAMKNKIAELMKSRHEYADKRKQEKLNMEERKLQEKRMRWDAMQAST